MRGYKSYRLLCYIYVALWGLSSCSIRQMQGEGDILYTGIKSIEVEGDKNTKEAEQALLATEVQLAYPPNNSVFGSSSTRWPLPLYRPWLYLHYADSKTWLGKALHRLGKKPVWVNDVNPRLRAKISERILGEHGYLRAEVKERITPNPKDSLEATVSYAISLGSLYRLDSVEYLPPIRLSDSIYLKHEQISPLKAGTPYAVSNLLSDRLMLSQRLREQGFYYFNPTFVSYEADSLQAEHRLQLRAKMQSGLAPEVLKPWRIGRVRVRFLDAEDSFRQSLQTHKTPIKERIEAFHLGRMPIRAKVLDSRIRLRPDSLYRQSLEELTIKSLSAIGSFSGTDIFYTPHEVSDSLDRSYTGVMDMTIVMKRDKPWHITMGAQVQHKTTRFVGPGALLMLSRRNLFGGGETLNISANAGYEWQLGQNPFKGYTSALNSYQFGADVSLTFPTLLIPGWLDHYFAYPTTTSFKLSGQRLNRAGYYGLNTISFAMNYDYQPSQHTQHNIRVLGIDYTQLSHITTRFADVLVQNPSLLLSLASQLIPSIGYTYTWHKKVGQGGRHSLWFRGSASEAGNLIKGLFVAAKKPFNETQNILGVPYAQFVKASTELRYTHRIDRKQSLATRLMLGGIYSYGNMKYAPYMEHFYVGGANSIRAFTIRSLGPGRFKEQAVSPYTFMDHVGEAKLELNMEFRRALTQSLELAVFLDAGNVWLIRPDKDRVGAALGEIKGIGDFLDQIAVGTGLGLRYDMTYLLIRLDAGVGLHLPYDTGRRGWYNIPKFSDGFGLHLAIGYPF